MPTLHPATPRRPARRSGRIGLVLVALALCLAPAPAAVAGSRGLRKDMKFAVDLARKGLWNEAEFRFRALLKKAPSDLKLWNNLAVACEATGDYPCAAEAYEKAVSLMSEPPEPLVLNKEAFDAFYRSWEARRRARSGGRPEPERGP